VTRLRLGLALGATRALFGLPLDLPYPISLHGDFYHWGTGGRTGDVTMIIFVCRRPRLDLASLFRRLGPDWD
jgi:hypothetical protein